MPDNSNSPTKSGISCLKRVLLSKTPPGARPGKERNKNYCRCEESKRRSKLKCMFIEKQYYVYIMTDAKHSTLYTGFSSNLKVRVWQHKGKFVESFTKRYHV